VLERDFLPLILRRFIPMSLASRRRISTSPFSHSVMKFTRVGAVGLDLEKIPQGTDDLGVGAAYFSCVAVWRRIPGGAAMGSVWPIGRYGIRPEDAESVMASVAVTVSRYLDLFGIVFGVEPAADGAVNFAGHARLEMSSLMRLQTSCCPFPATAPSAPRGRAFGQSEFLGDVLPRISASALRGGPWPGIASTIFWCRPSGTSRNTVVQRRRRTELCPPEMRC